MLNRETEAKGAESLEKNREWDAFLERSPLGQFQQSSGWARVKALDGWQVHRVYANSQRPGEGGLQLLWKRSRFGRIGYVSKGPILPAETPAAVNAIMVALKASAASLGVRGLILQPPDSSSISERSLIEHGFSRSPVESVVRATALVELTGGRDAIEKRMHSKTRQQTRAAAKRGVTIRIGNRSDIPCFFNLMLESCRRQNSQPNPSRPELLEALWDAFSPRVLLGLASCQGELVAGLLMVGHGSRMTFWKKGWNSHASQSYANCLLNAEALGWAADQGYTTVDFAALDHCIAEILLSGGTLTDSQRRSRYTFNFRLGAVPKLLPPARLLVVNPTLRRLHQLFSLVPALQRRLFQRIGLG
jgi:peptidoglycan pentaglycine glycine transferase (the first glycine)